MSTTPPERYEPTDATLERYGLTREMWEEMRQEQDGRCEICGEVPGVLVIDHEHARGNVRGLLCGGCNTGIGDAWDMAGLVAEANPSWEQRRVDAAVAYLLRWVDGDGVVSEVTRERWRSWRHGRLSAKLTLDLSEIKRKFKEERGDDGA